MSSDNDQGDMTPEEIEMMKALEQSPDENPADTTSAETDNTQQGRPAPSPSIEAHPVDVTPLQSAPRTKPDEGGNLKMIMDIPVEIRVEVGNSRLTIREILNLAPGAIIELDRTAGSPADIIVNGTTVGQGDVVIVEESYGIRITKLVTPEDRLNSL